MSGRSLENNSSGRNQNIHHDEISHQPCFKYEQERSLCQILDTTTFIVSLLIQLSGERGASSSILELSSRPRRRE